MEDANNDIEHYITKVIAVTMSWMSVTVVPKLKDIVAPNQGNSNIKNTEHDGQLECLLNIASLLLSILNPPFDEEIWCDVESYSVKDTDRNHQPICWYITSPVIALVH